MRSTISQKLGEKKIFITTLNTLLYKILFMMEKNIKWSIFGPLDILILKT